MRTHRIRILLAVAPALGVVSACTVGPDYQRPTAPAPTAYKELDGWKPAQPRQAASGVPWWSIYDDPVLDGIERQVDISNQTLKANEAAFREAAAMVAEARAGFFPTLALDATAQRSGQSLGSGSTQGRSGSVTQNQFSLTPTASWEPDIWGKIRRTVEAEAATAQASAADLAAARLSAQSQLAIDYFELRIDDELKRVLDTAIQGYQRSLDITRNQYNAGFAAQTDVITAQTQLQGTQAQSINLGVQRAQLEHAIAVLTGKPPAEFSIAPRRLATDVPVVPTGVPSSLLERRPDIAAAERAVAASNAEIGVAESAYYPDLTLSASFGYASSQLGNLIQASNSAWSVGGQLAETLFDGGLRSAQVEAARAAYDQSVATYRQTVLSGFQQVEDELAALRILEEEAKVEDSAAKSAEEAARLTLNQYLAGTVAYTNVVVAQVTALTDEQSALNILGNRLTASVTLVEALGGGWNDAELPAIGVVESDASTEAAAPAPSPSEDSMPTRIFKAVGRWFGAD